jgi:V8-like Glu-specific endopeptidase
VVRIEFILGVLTMTENQGGRLVRGSPPDADATSEHARLPGTALTRGRAAGSLVYGQQRRAPKTRATGKPLKPIAASAFSFFIPRTWSKSTPPPQIETDAEKRRVELPEIKGAPFKAICHLVIEYADGQSANGTGFVVGPRTVLTAGHCVYMPTSGSQAAKITVVPARQGETAPFGWYETDLVDFSHAWRDVDPTVPEPEHDYGAVFLRTDGLHQRVGYTLKCAAFSDADVNGIRVANVAGFPDYQDQAFVMECDDGPLVIDSAHPINQRLLYHLLDTHEGQSGGPIMHYNTLTGALTAFGIHTYGQDEANVARRIDPELAAVINRWVASPQPFMAGGLTS